METFDIAMKLQSNEKHSIQYISRGVSSIFKGGFPVESKFRMQGVAPKCRLSNTSSLSAIATT